jgi:hypothetical protein
VEELTMKIVKTFSAAAIVAVMACSAAHAQVLGGAVGGGLNGAASGGLRDTSVLTNGRATGSLSGEFDTGSAIRKTQDTADRTTRRARNVGANVRSRTESTVSSALETSADVATSAAAAAHAAKDQEINAGTEAAVSHSSVIEPQQDLVPNMDRVTSDVDGSASGNASASRKGIVADAAADGSAAAGLASKKDASTEAATPAEMERSNQ